MEPLEPEESYQVGRAGQMGILHDGQLYRLQDIINDILERLAALEEKAKGEGKT